MARTVGAEVILTAPLKLPARLSFAEYSDGAMNSDSLGQTASPPTWRHHVHSHASLRTVLSLSATKRKPSAAAQARAEEAELYRVWDHLGRLALHSVKRYFQQSDDGSKIPKTFQTNKDSYCGGLNNFSATFWKEEH